ncbi:hypothetical protein [Franconibacter helveticus]|uniref:hypothetical protein n=1 Tax=Franconibacter helveticus TaxID=357240 RepID=UPI002911932D|nr:hypothetical protein [Franconibacter helveticus]MDU6924028.1 hypothetical protein [Franconibacter helveticus]
MPNALSGQPHTKVMLAVAAGDDQEEQLALQAAPAPGFAVVAARQQATGTG